jgi:UDPglucose 6-dehydrogenase
VHQRVHRLATNPKYLLCYDAEVVSMGVRIAVLGTGYLGATHAACMADLGHDVLGVDVDETKLAKLQCGEVPFYEPGLQEVLRRNVDAGRLRFSSSYEEAASFADVHFLTVGTPQRKDGLAADLRHVEAAIDDLAPLLNAPAVIFGKSTVPAGTAAKLGARVRELAPAGDEAEVAWNPEFLREGFGVQDTLHPDRLVLGVDRDRPGRAEEVARTVYAPLVEEGIPFLVTDLATAELTKQAANVFLATKISFINAMSEMCDHAGADVTTLADALGMDPRIGHRFLQAGIGYGGGCLTKDIRAFIARARESGMHTAPTLLRAVDDINMRRRDYAIEVVREICGPVSGATVGVLGVAFKPNSDDVRDSPALDIAERIRTLGATVSVFDPKAMENARAQCPLLNYVGSVTDACADADVVLLLTEWSEFQSLRPSDLEPAVRTRALLDGRNCLSPREWRDAGWTYRSFGRP